MATGPRRLRRAVALAAALAAPLATAPAVSRRAALLAQACATVTMWQSGAPTTSGPHCHPLLDHLPTQCVFPGVVYEGNGLTGVVCIPRAA